MVPYSGEVPPRMDSVPSGRYARFIAADNALQLGARSCLIRLGLFSNVMEFPAAQTFWLDTHLAVVHFVLTTLIFFGYARYRSPIEPICIILATAGELT